MTASFNPAPVSENVERVKKLLRLQGVLLVLLAALSPFLLISVIRGLPADLEADHRLAPTFAIVHGYQLYYPPDSGPVLSTLYGPITAIFYLPATLTSTPNTAILIGTLWAMAVFFAAAFATVRQAAENSRMSWWQLLGLLAGLIWLVAPVERAGTHIHADAPALALAAMACLFAMREKHRFLLLENEMLAAISGVLAVFTKQNLAPVLVGLALWFAVRRARALLVFLASAIGCAALMTALTVTLLGSPASFYFNCIYMPLHQPFDRTLLFPTLAQVLMIGLALLIIPVAALLRRWTQSQASMGAFVNAQKTSLLMLIGVLMIPAAVAGRMKLGGNENSLGLALFFFVLALAAEISNGDGAHENEARIWSVPVLIVCVLAMTPAVYFSLKSRPAGPVQQAYVYAKQHPGKVYFPQFPLVHLMTEGKLYHFSWGLTDRRNAGMPLSDEHFRQNVPSSAEVIAVTEFVPSFEKDMSARQGPRLVDFSGAAQLPQFEFFAVPTSTAQK